MGFISIRDKVYHKKLPRSSIRMLPIAALFFVYLFWLDCFLLRDQYITLKVDAWFHLFLFCNFCSLCKLLYWSDLLGHFLILCKLAVAGNNWKNKKKNVKNKLDSLCIKGFCLTLKMSLRRMMFSFSHLGLNHFLNFTFLNICVMYIQISFDGLGITPWFCCNLKLIQTTCIFK